MKITKIIASIAASTILSVTLATPAAALNRVVTIINNTSYVIVEFYGSNKGTSSWEEDIFGYDVLGAYESLNIDFDDGTGYCIFDFKAVFDDGDVLVTKGINVCEIPDFTYN